MIFFQSGFQALYASFYLCKVRTRNMPGRKVLLYPVLLWPHLSEWVENQGFKRYPLGQKSKLLKLKQNKTKQKTNKQNPKTLRKCV